MQSHIKILFIAFVFASDQLNKVTQREANDCTKVVLRSAVAMSFTQDDGIHLQTQVQSLLQQMQSLMDQNATITQAFDTFRALATQEISNLKSSGNTGGGGIGTSLKLVDAKDFKPQVFTGQRNQEYKPWRKLFITYANVQCPGFRTALEWIENQKTEIDAIAIDTLNWPHSAEAHPKLRNGSHACSMVCFAALHKSFRSHTSI